MGQDVEGALRECAEAFGLGEVLGWHAMRTEARRPPSFRVSTATGAWLVEAFDCAWFPLDYVSYLTGYVRALAREGLAPELRATPEGPPFHQAAAGGETYRVVCREWVAGQAGEWHEWEDQYLTEVGSLLARVHDVGARWSPPAPQPAWNFSVSASHACAQAGDWPLKDPAALRLLCEAARLTDERLAELMARKDLHGPIHADCWYGNLVQAGGRLVAVDFEGSGIGPRAYDLAVWYYTIETWRPADAAAPFARLMSAYERSQPLEPVEAEAIPYLTALRHFWFLEAEATRWQEGREDLAKLRFYVDDHSTAIERLVFRTGRGD
jgi:Ser/Thr protein kinase RdoA (MazF antagonist)